jgi:hypothetical protein
MAPRRARAASTARPSPAFARSRRPLAQATRQFPRPAGPSAIVRSSDSPRLPGGLTSGHEHHHAAPSPPVRARGDRYPGRRGTRRGCRQIVGGAISSDDNAASHSLLCGSRGSPGSGRAARRRALASAPREVAVYAPRSGPHRFTGRRRRTPRQRRTSSATSTYRAVSTRALAGRPGMQAPNSPTTTSTSRWHKA